jgi:phenylpyruvate tautomerase PptA (4-oxalocrotonate tautomerase family)
MDHHFYHHPDKETAESLSRIECMLGRLEGHIMAAIDDLKANIASLITEATNDITTLVNNAAANTNDPAIQQLASDVSQATSDLHNKFTAATGTATPPPAPTQPAAT